MSGWDASGGNSNDMTAYQTNTEGYIMGGFSMKPDLQLIYKSWEQQKAVSTGRN